MGNEGAVVDASVMASWIFGEPRAARAKSLLAGKALYAPKLMGYELAHVASKKAARHPELTQKILQALGLAMRLDINWVDVDLVAASNMAIAENLTAYDASYLWLARKMGVTLLTFDEKLLRAAGKKRKY
ncbi:MAG: PIN domain-containing protein [Deltaproteobacteria bacterium]|nr:MAG: PIN domain-containing protein [Deltaproteobacteria bacterium]